MPPSDSTHLRLTVNGEAREVIAPTHHTLLEVLREDLNLCGTKHGCELGECGACAVLLDGQPVLSCLVPLAQCEGRTIETVEGIAARPEAAAMLERFVATGAVQCGACTPGIIVTAWAMLERHSDPDRAEVRRALAGNLCRCTGYEGIFRALAVPSDGEDRR